VKFWYSLVQIKNKVTIYQLGNREALRRRPESIEKANARIPCCGGQIDKINSGV